MRYAFHLCDREAGGLGLTQSILRERTRGHEGLERRLVELLQPPPAVPPIQERNVDTGQAEADWRRRQWVERVRPHADALRENKANPRLLYDLAMVHFGGFVLPGADTASQKGLAEVLEDDELVDAARAGLRGAVYRSDVPAVAEIIRLFTESQVHPLSLPFLAGMDELDRANSEGVESLSQLQMRQALAFNYCTPHWPRRRPVVVSEMAGLAS